MVHNSEIHNKVVVDEIQDEDELKKQMVLWCDAAWDESSCESGFGFSMKLEKGTTVMEGYDYGLANSPLMAEVKAIETAMVSAKAQGFRNFKIASNCQRAVKILKRESKCHWFLKELIKDINILASQMSFQGWLYMRRKFNKEVHDLAKSGIKAKGK
ncbi:hypothetical protein Cni_G23014 [Canna indica]|uniref:RNase H type-1 domain-containing protein n=1 Tax=Canna indica TaxID=4628 RepID=A0AAQ3QK34_9LILI|nr:hypothetical protein Cni_G23014 [Canna indica]